MFSVSQVNAHNQNWRQIKAQIDKYKNWDIKIVADEGKEWLDVTTGQNEVDTDDIECLEMRNGVDLWPKDWEEDEHDFCVVEKTDEHELQHDWKCPGVCVSFVDPEANNKYEQGNDTGTGVSFWDSFDLPVFKQFLFFSDIGSIVAAASPGIFLDIKWQEDADEIENNVNVVGSKKEANNKGRYKYDPIELALRCYKRILT